MQSAVQPAVRSAGSSSVLANVRTTRDQAIRAFFQANAEQLERAVRRNFVGPDATVEDACSHAWLQLVRHPEVTLDRSGFSWLYVVAIRHTYRSSAEQRREPCLGGTEDLPVDRSFEEWAAERSIRVRERMEMLASLGERQQRLVFLHGSGYSYEEISGITGDSTRTVERQMLRAKRALRELVAA